MDSNAWSRQDLASLDEAAHLLGAAFGSRAALYARVRRGTLFAVRVERHWYIPCIEIRRLKQQAKQGKQKRATIRETNFSDQTDSDLSTSVSLPKRGRAALEAQAFLRGTIRARLRRMYPDLSPREITYKYFREVARNG